MIMKGALISIHPRYVGQIMAGDKTTELRRRAPACSPGDLVVVYETSPTMAIVGIAEISHVECRAPHTLWDSVRATSGVTRREFRAYFAGTRRACAIHLTGMQRFRQPVTLAEIKRLAPGFRPPQSWCYLQSLPAKLVSTIQREASAGN